MAAAEALVGAFSPSGREPAAWPSTVGAVHSSAAPWLSRIVGDFVAEGHRSKVINPPGGRAYAGYVNRVGTGTPLVPFGHGVGFSSVTYESIRIQPNRSALAQASSWVTPQDWEDHHDDVMAVATVTVTREQDGVG